MIPLRQHSLFQQLINDLATEYKRFEVTAERLAQDGYTYDEMAAAIEAHAADLRPARANAEAEAECNTATPSRYRPDFGIFHATSAPPSTDHIFYDVPITRISRSDTVMWTTTLNYLVADTEFAVSFDMSDAMFGRLLAVALPTEATELHAAMRDMTPGESFDFVEPLRVTIVATLGEVVSLARETFRPFVVTAVHSGTTHA